MMNIIRMSIIPIIVILLPLKGALFIVLALCEIVFVVVKEIWFLNTRMAITIYKYKKTNTK